MDDPGFELKAREGSSAMLPPVFPSLDPQHLSAWDLGHWDQVWCAPKEP